MKDFSMDEPVKLCGTFKKSDCCGTPSGYAMGCRTEPCKSAGIAAIRKNHRSKPKKGTYVSVDRTRQHLRFLVANGAVARRIAEKVGVTPNTIFRLMNGTNNQTVITTEEDILALHLGMEDLFVSNRGKHDGFSATRV